MKPANTRARNFIALLLAIIMAISLAGCNGSLDTGDAGSIPDVGDTITAPAPEGNSAKSLWDQLRGNNKGATLTESKLKTYGEIETLVKSVSKPTAADSKNVQTTSYGTIDWSTAAQGYVAFTAKGQERVLVLQGPNDAQVMADCANGTTIKIALTDGAGKYQYAIGNHKTATVTTVKYKNSFTVNTIDSDLAPYLVSTPYGDYENAPNAVKKAAELWDKDKNQLENIQALADYVDNLKYDKKLEQGTLDVYVNPDSVIENGGGVCNEMSKLLVAMLRSQGVPAYFQGGYDENDAGHAWVMAWVELESSVKDGITSSKGAWVLIEATSGVIQTKTVAARDYTPDNYAN